MGRHLASSSSISGEPGTPEPQGPVADREKCRKKKNAVSVMLNFIIQNRIDLAEVFEPTASASKALQKKSYSSIRMNMRSQYVRFALYLEHKMVIEKCIIKAVRSAFVR